MRLVILYSGKYPESGALLNRISALNRGFNELGHLSIILVIYSFSEISLVQFEKIDNLNLNVKVLSGFVGKTNSIFIKIYRQLFGIAKTVLYLIRENNKQKIDVILAYTHNLIQIIPVFIFSRLANSIFIRELNEYPNEIIALKELSIFDRYKLQVGLYCFDGFIYISSYLKTYYSDFEFAKSKSIIIPIIVDDNEFPIVPSYPNTGRYNIVYCGNLYGDKDGVKDLLCAFKLILNTGIKAQLILIGDNTDAYKIANILKLIKVKEILHSIKFTGFLNKKEISHYFNEAHCFVLARPDNKQAEGGLPTKLGEYLATGKPVICTKVGELPLYLTDGVNVYFANPSAPISFAQRVVDCLTEFDEAKKIGIKGQELTKTVFNYRIQAHNLVQFFIECAS